jgi:hypothetical protein
MDNIDSSKQCREFSQLLIKCLALDLRRHPERTQTIHDFCNQAIRDSQYLVQGKMPDDIKEKIFISRSLLDKLPDKECQ